MLHRSRTLWESEWNRKWKRRRKKINWFENCNTIWLHLLLPFVAVVFANLLLLELLLLLHSPMKSTWISPRWRLFCYNSFLLWANGCSSDGYRIDSCAAALFVTTLFSYFCFFVLFSHRHSVKMRTQIESHPICETENVVQSVQRVQKLDEKRVAGWQKIL